MDNATDMMKPEPFPKWEPPVSGHPLFGPKKSEMNLPDYHEEPVYEYIPFIRLTEGIFV